MNESSRYAARIINLLKESVMKWQYDEIIQKEMGKVYEHRAFNKHHRHQQQKSSNDKKQNEMKQNSFNLIA